MNAPPQRENWGKWGRGRGYPFEQVAACILQIITYGRPTMEYTTLQETKRSCRHDLDLIAGSAMCLQELLEYATLVREDYASLKSMAEQVDNLVQNIIADLEYELEPHQDHLKDLLEKWR